MEYVSCPKKQIYNLKGSLLFYKSLYGLTRPRSNQSLLEDVIAQSYSQNFSLRDILGFLVQLISKPYIYFIYRIIFKD